LYLRAYDSLKKEIADTVKDERDLERSILLACGAIWTYLIGLEHQRSYYLWYVPTVLVGFGAVRTAALMMGIRPRAQYLRAMEDQTLQGMPLEGWERYFRSHFRPGVGVSMWFFWLGLLVATLVAPHMAAKP
jgi:hypothetical protein